jgi:hypothetical protein
MSVVDPSSHSIRRPCIKPVVSVRPNVRYATAAQLATRWRGRNCSISSHGMNRRRIGLNTHTPFVWTSTPTHDQRDQLAQRNATVRWSDQGLPRLKPPGDDLRTARRPILFPPTACRSGSTRRRRSAASALWLEMPMTVTTVLAVVIALVILLPAAVWAHRLQARGVITEDRPLDRVIRECITGKPAGLTPPDYRQSRLRYYRMAFLTVPIIAVGVAAIVAALTTPQNPVGLTLAPALLAGIVVLSVSEDRFTGVSRRRRTVCAGVSGGIVAVVAFVVILGVDLT